MDNQQARVDLHSDKPSEDMRRHWHFAHSPSFDGSASYQDAGKWCIYVSTDQIDASWNIIRNCVDEDRFLCAKVSTAFHSIPYDSHLICVYTEDWNDREDVMRVREVLRVLGFADELRYKRDVDTRSRKYGGADEWYFKA